MPQKPPAPRVSVAHADGEGRLHAPAAERNADALLDLLSRAAPASGTALELASGTGQHVTRFATALPGLTWQPSEVSRERLHSIALWSADAPNGTVLPAVLLDATAAGWGGRHTGKALVLLVNLLHLIPERAARTLIFEVAQALAPGGRFIFYGPFLRDGKTTSDGDARFHKSLRAQDPQIGYKNDRDVVGWLQDAGLDLVETVDMPANNLAFVAERPQETG